VNYKIIVTPKFSKNIKQLKKKYKKIKEDFEECIDILRKNPFSGTSLGSGLYKLRLKSSDVSKGKSDTENISMDRIKRILEELRI
jgi:mRNA-degrading endonuclease RelE of RelBE toxin-antitoxin system